MTRSTCPRIFPNQCQHQRVKPVCLPLHCKNIVLGSGQLLALTERSLLRCVCLVAAISCLTVFDAKPRQPGAISTVNIRICERCSRARLGKFIIDVET
jgi:hypothetical protein